MPKPCRADGHGDAPAPGCRVCELAATRADYAALWGEPPPTRIAPPLAAPAVPAPAPTCPHLGGATGGTVACASCNRDEPVMLPLYRCGLRGLTVLGDRRPKAADVAACRWCPDRPGRLPAGRE